MLSVLESPYSADVEQKIGPQSKSSEAESERGSASHAEFTLDHKAPRWAHQLRVT